MYITKSKGFYLKNYFYLGLEERSINSADQILQAMREGEEIRKFGVTNMNDHSSRSHTIFRYLYFI